MIILITGASSGIGYAAALLLSKQGHSVFAVARNKDKLLHLQQSGVLQNIQVLEGDITNDEFLRRIYETVRTHSGHLDILINNAGLLINKPFEELQANDWLNSYQTNVFAPALLTKQMLPLMRTGGHILNISSMGGFQGSAKFKGLAAYSSSKAALVGLTECLAEELKERAIAVNCLCLGSAQTEMFSKAFPDFKASTTVEEMASFVAHFATTGQALFNGKIIPVANSVP